MLGSEISGARENSSFSDAFEIKGDYMEVGESKAGTGLWDG